MESTLQFADGEKVLCLYEPLIYDGICLKSKVKENGELKYFIHYSGWNKNWDEWVAENRVLKYNETNLAKQEELQRIYSIQTSAKSIKSKNRKSETGNSNSSISTPPKRNSWAGKRKPSSTSSSRPDTGSVAAKKKHRRLNSTVTTEEQYLNKLETKVKLPDELKQWLVDDRDIITRQQKLPKLPTRITVDEIINNYLAHKKSAKNKNSYQESAALEFSNGIKEYFNVMLATQLLYKFEKLQYAQILQEKPDLPVSKIYGAIHLLRFFVKLGTVLGYAPLDERSVQLLVTNIQDFLKYMHKNSSSLLSLQDYTTVLPE